MAAVLATVIPLNTAPETWFSPLLTLKLNISNELFGKTIDVFCHKEPIHPSQELTAGTIWSFVWKKRISPVDF